VPIYKTVTHVTRCPGFIHPCCKGQNPSTGEQKTCQPIYRETTRKLNSYHRVCRVKICKPQGRNKCLENENNEMGTNDKISQLCSMTRLTSSMWRGITLSKMENSEPGQPNCPIT